MKNITAGFIGFGLIGGSIARSLKDINRNNTLVAFHYNKDKPNASLQEALSDGTLDFITTTLSEGFEQCDYIFLCAPVLTNIDYLQKLKPIIKSTCIITDVGSVKGNIHKAVTLCHLDSNFIGGHPMAGSEKTGYHNSSGKLLENAYYILTPTLETPKYMVDEMVELVKDIGAIPVILGHKEHDDITAAISHVPHIIATNLVNMVKSSDDEKGQMRALAAGGFKDITRIASSSPVMWQNICLTNTTSIKNFLERYKDSIQDFIDALEQQNENFLLETFSSAKDYRDSIPKTAVGMLDKIFEVYVDIIDEAGAIATIASLLAKNDVNIKNIGILHNREFEDGVLRIELYNQSATEKTIDLLRDYSYTIYQR